MRGILFAVSFVSSLIALFSSIDTVGAMDGVHVGVSWIWWAVALVFLQLMPPRTIDITNVVEVAEELWFDVDLSDLNTFDETLDVEVIARQIEIISQWIGELVNEIQATQDLIDITNTWVFVDGPAEEGWMGHNVIVSTCEQGEFLPSLGHTPLRSRNLLATRAPAWLPPSLGLKA
jgi:hypothetical protein